MNASFRPASTSPFRRALPVPLLMVLLLATFAHAQQRPLTGSMLTREAAQPAPAAVRPPAAAPTTSAPEIAPAAAATPARPVTGSVPEDAATPPPQAIGRTTRDLLRLQASNDRPGNHLPILGDQATASYRRYLDSFDHPLPEFFETNVADDGSH